MIWPLNQGNRYIALAFVLLVFCLLTSADCGQSKRFETKRRTPSTDPLAGRIRSDPNRNRFAPSSPDSDKEEDGQTIKRPAQVISSSRFVENFSLTSASVSTGSQSRSSSSPPPPPLPSPSPSPSAPDSIPPSPEDVIPYENYELPLPSPPKFPGAYDGVLSRDVTNMVASNNQFGYKLFKALIKFQKNENIFISPLSLFSTLMTVYAGSSSSTEQEMINLLQLKSMTEIQVQEAFRDVLASLLDSLPKKIEVKALNAIFADNDLNISSSYVDKIRVYYNADLHKVHFSTSASHETQRINSIVSTATNGLIPTLLDSPLDSLTRLLLINVVYFKGAWAEPFNPSLTNEQYKFHNYDQTISTIPLMRSTTNVAYYCDYNGLKACFAEKLYSGGTISFVLIVPTNGTDLTYIETLLGTSTIEDAFNQLQETNIELGLPRFSVSGSYDLLNPLEYLGMKSAFSPEKADLSKMGYTKELFVKDAKHKAIIQVTEEGTLSAGATIVEIGTRKRSPRLIVDRPFIFMIRDRRTNANLFLGRVNSLP